jgi:TolB-like protein/Tfp pilus assembly protein PilF
MQEDLRPGVLLPEQRAAVRDHLQNVLSSDAFKGGKRAQDFLQLVVEHTLAGRLDSLRERMLGAEMFGRPIDYDTGNDSVVRVKASEVRRRLAGYYQTLKTPTAVRIELPTGTYVPQFQWAPIEERSNSPAPEEPANSQPDLDVIEGNQPPPAGPAATSGFSLHSQELSLAVVVSLVAAAIFGIYLWRNSPERSQIHSIAILPLANLSGDPNQEYFADGMTEELTRDMRHIASLRVISSTSASTFKGTKKPLGQIARELAVDGIVEGSIEREGDRVRITIQLYEAKSNQQVWAQPYVRDTNSALELQSDVARGIADQIQLKLSSPEEARLSRSLPIKPGAVDLYLRGLEQLNSGKPSGAIEILHKAVAQDPQYSAPHAALADCYDLMAERGEMANDEASSREKAEALKAIELDETNPEGHLELGQAALNQNWDWTTFQHELERAKELDPNSARLHWAYSSYFNSIGRQDEALAEAKIALQFDPASFRSHLNMAVLYLALQQFDQAASEAKQAEESGQGGPGPSIVPGIADVESGRYDEAIQAFKQIGDAPLALGRLGNAYARASRTAEARAIIPKLEGQIDRTGIGRYGIALIYAALNDRDHAFQWLDKAYQAHEYMMIFLKIDPALSPLRSDPRFGDLVHRVGFPVIDNEALTTDPLTSEPPIT